MRYPDRKRKAVLASPKKSNLWKLWNSPNLVGTDTSSRGLKVELVIPISSRFLRKSEIEELGGEKSFVQCSKLCIRCCNSRSPSMISRSLRHEFRNTKRLRGGKDEKMRSRSSTGRSRNCEVMARIGGGSSLWCVE